MKNVYKLAMGENPFKLLMFSVKEFWYNPYSKTLKNVEETEKEETVNDALVVFVNVEKEDETNRSRIIRKTVKNIAWLARKTDRTRIVLHSFAHLSDSKSSTEFAQDLIQIVKTRLDSKGYDVSLTPFGYFLEFRLHVRGESLAKVWKQIH